MMTPVRELLEEIRESQVRIEERCIACRTTQDEHHRALFGSNGRMGIKSKAEIMWWSLGGVAAFLTVGGGGVLILNWLHP